MAKILGLDLGTNSIGWAVVEEEKKIQHPSTFTLLDEGVHIFSEGVKIEKGKEFSRAAERTGHRSARRLKFRRKLRKQKTMEVLIENKMCPLTMEELNEWRKNKTAYPTNPEFLKWLRTDEQTGINPYFFRDKASREKLPQLQLGRAFYHLSQRRGFLSNRLDQGDDGLIEQFRNELLRTIDAESNLGDLNAMLSVLFDSYKEEEDKGVRKLIRSAEKIQKENKNKSIEENKDSLLKFLNKKENLGAVKKGIADITQKMNEAQCETLGQYFYKLYQQKEKIRTHYTARNEHYLGEFKKICEIQKLPEELNKELEKAIFYQRPLKSQKGLVAKCTFEKKKARCPGSHPAFEEYRALQFINSIKVGATEKGKKEFLSKEERQTIWHKFTRKSKPNFDFSEIAKELTPKDQTRFFNYTDYTSVSGCFTIAQLINIFGENYKESIYEKYANKKTKKGQKTIEDVITDIWHVLFSFDDKNGEIKKWGEEKLGLDAIQAKKIGAIILKQDYASLSLKAINKILPYLREGLIYSHAVFLANMENVVGIEIWSRPENQKIIREALMQLIENFNEEKQCEGIVNDLIAGFKQEYNNSHKEYKLDEQDKKEIKKKILSVFGNIRFESFTPEKQSRIISLIETKLTEQLRKYRGEFIKPKRLDEKIAEFLKDNFNLSDDALSKLYHPSDMETFKTPKRADDGKLYLGSPKIASIKNPMAMRTMHQLRKLVNTLISEEVIDEETKIHIELARELNDANKRKAIQDWQKERKDAREKYKEQIKELYKAECGKDIEPTEDEILKFQLWAEQDHKCLYTDNPKNEIKISDFIGANPKYDIEHTIPKSLSYDNSQENLTLCEIRFNREVKRNQIPSQLPNHKNILARLSKWEQTISEYEKLFNSRKKARGVETKEQKDKRIRDKHYFKLHLDYWKGKHKRFVMKDVPEGFKNSQLVDTGIITKYSRSYLKSIFPKVYSVKGSAVAEFRKLWGLQEEYGKKERVNHIHHCIDAITIACMTKDKYDILAKLYHADEEGFQKEKKETFKIMKPWATFTEDVKAIEQRVLVSHHTPDNMKKQTKKKLRKRGKVQLNKEGNPIYQQGDTVRGSLHKETFYGAILVKERDKKTGEVITDENGKINRVEKYVIRIELSKLKETDVANIVDPVVKEKVEAAIKEHEFKKAMASEIWMNKEKGIRIKKVRVFAPTVTNPIKLKKHRDVSHYVHKQNYHVMNDGNYLMAIYEGKNKAGKTVRDFAIVNMLEAGEQLKLSNRNLSALVKNTKIVGKGKNEIEIPLKATIRKGTMALFYENNPEEIWELTDEEKVQRLYKVQKFRDDSRITFRFHQEARADNEINNLIKADNPIGSPQLRLSIANYNFLVEGYDFNITTTGRIEQMKPYVKTHPVL